MVQLAPTLARCQPFMITLQQGLERIRHLARGMGQVAPWVDHQAQTLRLERYVGEPDEPKIPG